MALFSLAGLKALFSLTNIVGSVKKTVAFVIENWRECAIAALIGTVVYQNMFETEWLSWFGLRTIPGLEQEVSIKNEQLQSCELSRERLKGAIQSTNEQIDKWANLSQDLQQSHSKLAEELDQMEQQRQKATEQILNEPTPKTCEAAIKYLKDGSEDLQWQE